MWSCVEARYHTKLSDRQRMPCCCLAQVSATTRKRLTARAMQGLQGGTQLVQVRSWAGQQAVHAACISHSSTFPPVTAGHQPAWCVLSPPLRRPWQPTCANCSRQYSSSSRACSTRCRGARACDQAPVFFHRQLLMRPSSSTTQEHMLCVSTLILHAPMLLPLPFHAAAIRPCSSSWSASTMSATAASGRCCSLSHRRWACSSRWTTCSGSCTWQLQGSRSCRALSTTCEWQQGVGGSVCCLPAVCCQTTATSTIPARSICGICARVNSSDARQPGRYMQANLAKVRHTPVAPCFLCRQAELQGAAQQAADARTHLTQLHQQMEQLAAATREAEAGADAAAGWCAVSCCAVLCCGSHGSRRGGSGYETHCLTGWQLHGRSSKGCVFLNFPSGCYRCTPGGTSAG